MAISCCLVTDHLTDISVHIERFQLKVWFLHGLTWNLPKTLKANREWILSISVIRFYLVPSSDQIDCSAFALIYVTFDQKMTRPLLYLLVRCVLALSERFLTMFKPRENFNFMQVNGAFHSLACRYNLQERVTEWRGKSVNVTKWNVNETSPRSWTFQNESHQIHFQKYWKRTPMIPHYLCLLGSWWQK